MDGRVGCSAKITIHGTLTRVNGEGILFLGEPGSGKSTAALSLLARGQQIVADDVVVIERVGRCLIGSAPTSLKGVLSVPEIGIFDVREVFGPNKFIESSRIDRFVELVLDTYDHKAQFEEFLGICVPKSFQKIASANEFPEMPLEINFDLVRCSEKRILWEHNRLVALAS